MVYPDTDIDRKYGVGRKRGLLVHASDVLDVLNISVLKYTPLKTIKW